MYVRIHRSQSGKLYLQQYLKFQQPSSNGRPAESIERWETVPTMSNEGNEALSLPFAQSCGTFVFECEEDIFSSIAEGHKRIKTSYFVSALDIYKVSMQEKYLQVFTRDKIALKVQMQYHEFLELMTEMMNNFKIIKFDINGKLIREV